MCIPLDVVEYRKTYETDENIKRLKKSTELYAELNQVFF